MKTLAQAVAEAMWLTHDHPNWERLVYRDVNSGKLGNAVRLAEIPMGATVIARVKGGYLVDFSEEVTHGIAQGELVQAYNERKAMKPLLSL